MNGNLFVVRRASAARKLCGSSIECREGKANTLVLNLVDDGLTHKTYRIFLIRKMQFLSAYGFSFNSFFVFLPNLSPSRAKINMLFGKWGESVNLSVSSSSATSFHSPCNFQFLTRRRDEKTNVKCICCYCCSDCVHVIDSCFPYLRHYSNQPFVSIGNFVCFFVRVCSSIAYWYLSSDAIMFWCLGTNHRNEKSDRKKRIVGTFSVHTRSNSFH